MGNECDHIVGQTNYKYDLSLIKKSNQHIWDKNEMIYFKFCPECGEKLGEQKTS
jgi:hypothetical protein